MTSIDWNSNPWVFEYKPPEAISTVRIRELEKENEELQQKIERMEGYYYAIGAVPNPDVVFVEQTLDQLREELKEIATMASGLLTTINKARDDIKQQIREG